MNTTQTNSSITSCRRDSSEFKGISIVQDDHNCSNKGCNLDHNTLAFFLTSEIETLNCKEDYQEHKDDSSEDSKELKGANRIEGSLIYTDRFSNCGSISCRSSSRKSFTFPVLRSEWPDSPVRMVGADRRHHQRRWTCFLCFKL